MAKREQKPDYLGEYRCELNSKEVDATLDMSLEIAEKDEGLQLGLNLAEKKDQLKRVSEGFFETIPTKKPVSITWDLEIKVPKGRTEKSKIKIDFRNNKTEYAGSLEVADLPAIDFVAKRK